MLTPYLRVYCLLTTAHLIWAREKIDCDNFPEIEENCCNVPDLNPEGLDEDKVSEQCVKEFKEGSSKIDEDYLFECVEECVFKKFGFLDSNGELDREMIAQSIGKQFVSDEVWKEKFIQGSNMCIDGARNMVNDKSPCKSGAGYFTMCLGTELIKNCPKEFWNESANCTVFKEYLEQCPEIAM